MPKGYNATTLSGREFQVSINAEDSNRIKPSNQGGNKRMQKQTIQFAVQSKNGVVQRVGKSTILQPKTNFKGGSVKWFDDNKLLKKGGVINDR